jgi:hypothetical protein
MFVRKYPDQTLMALFTMLGPAETCEYERERYVPVSMLTMLSAGMKIRHSCFELFCA